MRAQHRQLGVVLFTSLVMLVVMTLIGLAAIRLSTVNLRIVNNMQLRQEERSAVQRAIEQAMSSDFSVAWASGTLGSSMTVAVNSERDFDVSLTRCMKGVNYVSNSDIFTECFKPAASLISVDRIGYCACITEADYEARVGAGAGGVRDGGGALVGGVQDLGSGTALLSGIFSPSRCGRVRFNIDGVVTDTFSGASTRINQGVALLKSDTKIKQLRTTGGYCTS